MKRKSTEESAVSKRKKSSEKSAGKGDNADVHHLEAETVANNFYRKVIHTIPEQFQLVYMSLDEGETIPREIHPHTVQFIRIEEGNAKITVGATVYNLDAGDSITIPPNNYHLVENTTKGSKKAEKKLKLYTIYTPPEHPPTRKQRRQPKEQD